MTWIRVDSKAFANYKLGQFRERLDSAERAVNRHEALGLLVTVWGWVIENHWSGDLRKVGDEDIELGAHWRGEPGRLATAFRDVYCVRGQINDWLDYAGKLVDWRKKDAARKRAVRTNGAGHLPDGGET